MHHCVSKIEGPQNWFPEAAVMAPSLSEFKPYGLVSGSLVRSRELGSMILMGPFQLEIFYDSMISTVVYDKYITSHVAFLAQYAQIAYFFQSINDLSHLK